MSLKQFHLFFIACSFALMLVVVRSGQCVPAGLAGAALSVLYLAWFVRKYKTLS
jgi:hypothetical protein